jgi:hypothetical protein
MKKCDRKDCTRRATHHLVAKVWALGSTKADTPITSVIGLTFCKSHARDEADSLALIGEEFWRVLFAATRSLGKMPPDPASLELTPMRGDAEEALAAMQQPKARLN